MWSKLRKVLGTLTDILTLGRKAGWWSKKHGPSGSSLDLDRPADPRRPR